MAPNNVNKLVYLCANRVCLNRTLTQAHMPVDFNVAYAMHA